MSTADNVNFRLTEQVSKRNTPARTGEADTYPGPMGYPSGPGMSRRREAAVKGSGLPRFTETAQQSP